MSDPSGSGERLARKRQHLELSLKGSDGPLSAGFDDVRLVHQAATDVSLHDISLHTRIWGRVLPSPFFIDAMTGGPAEASDINQGLAEAARGAGWGMAVGSQRIALDDPRCSDSFSVVRGIDPDGFILANLSARASPSEAVRAVEMVGADVLQLHLNPCQEILMVEGERNFAGTAECVARTVSESPVPVVAKEVGSGISAESARVLIDAGVSGINVAGAGGTNFARIEMERCGGEGSPPVFPGDFAAWGLPTCSALAETAAVAGAAPRDVAVVASGGVRSPLDAVKSMVMGADLVSVAAPALRVLSEGGAGGLSDYLGRWNADVRRLLFLLNVRGPAFCHEVPYVITGETAEYLRGRGFCTSR